MTSRAAGGSGEGWLLGDIVRRCPLSVVDLLVESVARGVKLLMITEGVEKSCVSGDSQVWGVETSDQHVR